MTNNDIALVTGANKGIGKEIARQLGGLGHTVVIGSRDEERGRRAAAELTADGIDARSVPLDVADPESVAAAVKQVESDFGRLDVLVNNAGVLLNGDGPALETPIELVRATYEVNVLGVLRVTNAFLPLLRSAPRARIVNMSSELGSLERVGDPASPWSAIRFVGYNSSKSAVNALTVAFANELRDAGIVVNAADPGHCATDMGGPDAPRTATQGAAVAVRLATLGPGGPTGEFHNEDGRLPW
jgi:NAD(P)-dependent dehydrogenase (short-subunit alcohol dehydrogenase family)